MTRHLWGRMHLGLPTSRLACADDWQIVSSQPCIPETAPAGEVTEVNPMLVDLKAWLNMPRINMLIHMTLMLVQDSCWQRESE